MTAPPVMPRTKYRRGGSLKLISSGDASVLAFLRESGEERVLAAINFATEGRSVVLPPGRWSRLFDTDAPQPDPATSSGGLAQRGLQALLLNAVGEPS